MGVQSARLIATGPVRLPGAVAQHPGYIGAIYGAVGPGRLKLYNGASTAGNLVLDVDLDGEVHIEPPASWHFTRGIYAEFADGLAGGLTFVFT